MHSAVARLVVLLCCAIATFAENPSTRTIHVFVALADNQHQGIVPVPARLGNGLDAAHNLYWGAAAGVKTYFARSSDWTLLQCSQPQSDVLERCIFKHRQADVYLVADAYRGDAIRHAIQNFFDAAAGAASEKITLPSGKQIAVHGGANLVAYVGHDGLMDFQLPSITSRKNNSHRDAIVLACASKQYFSDALHTTGAYPLLWTTNLMAPEAYTLKSALDGWIKGTSGADIRGLAAAAYDKYQKCGLRAATRLFATGW